MTTETSTATAPDHDPPSTAYSLSALVVAAGILLVGTLAFDAPIELLMFFALVALIPIVMRLGYTFTQCEDMAFDAIRKILGLVFILFAVGSLLGSWALSGTIPAIIHVGLQTISPTWFLLTSLILCSLTSLATGTSWGTMGSVGVALMAVAASMDVHTGLAAGAVISGAYFGDKLSPLSDSTNLAAAVTGTPLMVHIRYMLLTTAPAFALTAALFAVLGFTQPADGASTGRITEVTETLDGAYNLGFPTLLPVLLTVAILFLRVPAFVAILTGAFAGLIVAVLYQGANIDDALTVMHSGYVADTGLASVDDLITGGGIIGMAPLALLFIFAVGMSGLLSTSGMVTVLLRPILTWASTPRRIMLASPPTMLSGMAIGASFSFGAVMTATILGPAYRDLDLRSENLSRTIEDSGTVYDPFFPWSGGGVFAAATLGIATFDYMPFMFFAYFSLLCSLIVSATQYKVRRIDRSVPTPPESTGAAISPDGETASRTVGSPDRPQTTKSP